MNITTHDDRYLRIDKEFDQQDYVVFRSLPGAVWDQGQRAWYVPRVHLPTLARHYEVPEANTPGALRAAKELPQPVVHRTESWQHQLQAYHFASQNDATMLAMEMGSGKSKVVVDLIQNDPEAKRVLIVAPSTVVRDEVWNRQFAQHGARDDIHVLSLGKGEVSKRAQKLRDWWTLPGTRVAVVNYEAVWRQPMGHIIEVTGVDWLVADESHRAKSPSGKLSRWLGKAPKWAKRRLALTGTPLPHSPLDAWAQFRFLEPDLFGTSFTSFRHRYAILVNVPSLPAPLVKGYQNVDELEARMDCITYRAGPEVLDLPEETHEHIGVELEPKAQKTYRQLEREFITEIESGVVTAGNALTRLLRLQQLTGGWLQAENAEKAERVSTAKQEALKDLLGDMSTGESIVVFCRFRADLDAVQSVAVDLERPCHELSGRAHELEMWRETEGSVLAVQIQSGDVGIDLTKARYCVYYSLHYSLGDYLQSLRRVHRPGQERPVTYYHMIARGTVDEAVYKALQSRQEVVEAVLAEVGR